MSNSILSIQDQARLAQLEASYPSNGDFHWLRGLVEKLAAFKHTEAEFPEKLALLNTTNLFTCAIRFAGRVPAEQTLDWVDGEAETVTLFSHKLDCAVSDAFLVVRPYVKLLTPGEELLTKLEGWGRIQVLLDEEVAYEGALLEILVDLEGRGMLRQALTLRHKRAGIGFGALPIQGDAVVEGKDVGIFVSDQTVVKVILIYPIQRGEELKFATGLVMARYTTKGIDWSIQQEIRRGQHA